tara:strand:+ start:510 stop:1685 length:1176 start_codon:yes stop_codon:yes gene_type:complete
MQKRGKGINRDKNSLLTLVNKLLYWLGFIIALIGAFKNYILVAVGLFIMFLSLIFYKLPHKSSTKFKKQKKSKKKTGIWKTKGIKARKEIKTSEKNKIKIYHITKIVYKLRKTKNPKKQKQKPVKKHNLLFFIKSAKKKNPQKKVSSPKDKANLKEKQNIFSKIWNKFFNKKPKSSGNSKKQNKPIKSKPDKQAKPVSPSKPNKFSKLFNTFKSNKPPNPNKPTKTSKLPKLNIYQILFLISLIIIIVTIIFRNLITFILGITLMFLSLLGHKKAHKPVKSTEKKPQKKEVASLDKINIKREKYETDFDILYKFVQKRKSIKFSEIEKYFKISKDLVEEWCSIMESHGLLKVYYPPFGEPELRTKHSKESKNPKKPKDNKISPNIKKSIKA